MEKNNNNISLPESRCALYNPTAHQAPAAIVLNALEH